MDLAQTPSAMLPLQGASPDFDYGAFLAADVDFNMTEENNYYSTSLSDSSAHKTSPTPPASSEMTRSMQSQKQRLERRGHTKSRRGCFNCKRRRIKVTAALARHLFTNLTIFSVKKIGPLADIAPRLG
jgi:hypothetical protein